MNILVTGGAGYIGSTAVKSLIEKGHSVVVIDNLSKGIIELVHPKAKFYKIDLTDKNGLKKVFKNHNFDKIMHFSAYKAVGESMFNAVKYSDNITGMINLLNCMVEFKVPKIIFSSSAAVYGIPSKEIVDEETPVAPISFYGYTKLAMENLIEWYSKIHKISYIALRYFNVAGDSGLKYIDPEANNIFPIIMEVINGKRDKLTIFGNDYKTKDGTCIRDYIDVNDLVDAHILALDCEFNGVINLGTGKGFSVKELLDSFVEVYGKKIPFEYGKRREGDPAALIASNIKAKKFLSWNPKRDVKEMIRSTLIAYGIKPKK